MQHRPTAPLSFLSTWAALGSLALGGCRSTDVAPRADDVTRAGAATDAEELNEFAGLRVAFLIVDGVYNTELTAPYDMFQHTVFHTHPGMRVFTVAPSLDPVTTFEGLRVLPDFTFTSAPSIDVLVVPSAEHSMDSDLENDELIAFVRRTGASADYVMSLCDGAFVLAEAGLLDGRQATTFPSDIQRMREMYPAVNILDGPSFVHDGTMITSVGGAPSFEAALYLCEHLYGARVARGIAGGLVIRWNLTTVEHVIVP